MTRRPLFVALAVLAACKGAGPPQLPAVPVSVAKVIRRDTPIVLTATGTIEPMQTSAVQAQVDGIITKVTFREGQDVKAGQVLFELDARQYRSALDGAEAAL